MKKLEYNIHNCSSYSPNYLPENIKRQNSSDSSSRWSSDSNVPPQFITCKLLKPAVVKTITFGKYEQTHACNVKRFKIFGGMEEDHLMELFVGNLKNDNVNETFTLRHTIGDVLIPIRFVKIMPVLSWSPSFNFTIWYVELSGDDEQILMDDSIKRFNTYREREIVRLCMKHFRTHNYKEALQALESDTNIMLEDPQLTELHNILVINADYDATEKFLENSVRNGLFDEYITNKDYTPCWEQLEPLDNSQIQPGVRGGHQMCIDPYTSTVYLFGGWDGYKDLNDLWSYDVNAQLWTRICTDAANQGGPSPRSCHKMVLDTKRKQIFILGRYLDMQFRSSESVQSDFYMYDIQLNKWLLICEDTSVLGGPFLIFDHQMCMDVEERTLYVFGGRVLSQQIPHPEDIQSHTDTVFSGLFAYHVSTNTWKGLLVDCGYSGLSPTNTVFSRVGHSMLFHPVTRKLYVFAGQRNKEYINDFFTYEVDTQTLGQVYKFTENEIGICPTPGFTQRATMDPDTDEIFVLSGLSKEKEKREDHIQNSIWIYKIKENKWECIYQSDNNGETYWNKTRCIEPCPRFAHQLVYDHVHKVHYLFGGNPGRVVMPNLRLDDFWKLRLSKPTQSELFQRCRMMIRKHCFKELARTDSVAALMYLRTKLSEIIDHNDSKQIKEFHSLAPVLFCDKDDYEMVSSGNAFPESPSRYDTLPAQSSNYYRRARLYESLTEYFPESMVQPKGSLEDLLKL